MIPTWDDISRFTQEIRNEPQDEDEVVYVKPRRGPRITDYFRPLTDRLLDILQMDDSSPSSPSSPPSPSSPYSQDTKQTKITDYFSPSTQSTQSTQSIQPTQGFISSSSPSSSSSSCSPSKAYDPDWFVIASWSINPGGLIGRADFVVLQERPWVIVGKARVPQWVFVCGVTRGDFRRPSVNNCIANGFIMFDGSIMYGRMAMDAERIVDGVSPEAQRAAIGLFNNL